MKQVMFRRHCVTLCQHVVFLSLEILHFDWLVNWLGNLGLEGAFGGILGGGGLVYTHTTLDKLQFVAVRLFQLTFRTLLKFALNYPSNAFPSHIRFDISFIARSTFPSWLNTFVSCYTQLCVPRQPMCQISVRPKTSQTPEKDSTL